MRLGNYDLIMYPLELALEACNIWEWAKEPPNLDSYILTIFHGDGHDVYYVICFILIFLRSNLHSIKKTP
ncbi:hypothetical protein [Crocosphaera sp. Alani8]|uniref:hypothetical protein n=1 Tax=Crocosphaera sp. Alani8 TaxID=3038952 RepID=UPI00313ED15B